MQQLHILFFLYTKIIKRIKIIKLVRFKLLMLE